MTPYIRSGAWFSHSEALLLTLVSSPIKEEREFGVNRILEIRGQEVYGDLSGRPWMTPIINLEAKTLTILISWDKDIHELVFKAKFPRDIVQYFVDTPFNTP